MTFSFLNSYTSVVDNYMYPLGWATGMPRYFVQHYSGCACGGGGICEGISG